MSPGAKFADTVLFPFNHAASLIKRQRVGAWRDDGISGGVARVPAAGDGDGFVRRCRVARHGFEGNGV